jgi:hypothetical protein
MLNVGMKFKMVIKKWNLGIDFKKEAGTLGEIFI